MSSKVTFVSDLSSVYEIVRRWDFSRSINPAFLERASSIPQKLQNLIAKLLPLLNAYAPARHALSATLLAAHLKDLIQEGIDLFRSRRDWDELKPEMQKTAMAVTRLALSIWFPFLYLTGSAVVELWTHFEELNASPNRMEAAHTAGRILIQSLYLISLMAESPSWEQTLKLIQDQVSGKDESENPDAKETLRHSPVLLTINGLLKGFSILPLIFRSPQPNPSTALPLISNLHRLGCMVQAFINAYVFFSVESVLQSLSFKHVVAFQTGVIVKDFAGEFIKGLHTIAFLTKTLIPIVSTLETIESVLDLLERWGWAKNYHIGATGERVQMEDVVGCDEAKKSVLKIVDQLKNRKKYARLGPVKLIKGILLYGPPGVGKTMLAKAVAIAVDAYFLEQSGSSFDEVYVGEGAKRVRKLFSDARFYAQQNPGKLVVIFIDEINAIGAPRLVGNDGLQGDNSQTTEAFLTEMDRLPPNVVVIGATNMQPTDLDPAFVRAGRFDEHVKFELPNSTEREAILTKLLQKYTVDPNIRPAFWKRVVRESEGWNYADIKNFIQQAASEAGFLDLPQITQGVFEETLKKLKRTQKCSSSSHLSIYS